MEKEQRDDELLRLAIITLLFAAMFGILQFFEGKTFDSIETGLVLKVIALVMLRISFLVFSIYIIILGLNLRYNKGRSFMKLQSFFYDLGIFLTIYIIIFTLLFASLIWLLSEIQGFPMEIAVGIIWILIIVGAIIFSVIMVRSKAKKGEIKLRRKE